MLQKFKKVGTIAGATSIAMAGFFFLFAYGVMAQATAVRLLGSAGVRPALEDILPQIEKSIGHPITPHFGSSSQLNEAIQSGEAFDLAIVSNDVMNGLVKQGKIAPDSRTEIGRVWVGVGAKAGAPKPDISTPEAFKRTMLNAKAVTIGTVGASAALVPPLFERLGIAAQMKPKLIVESAPGGTQKNVIDGKADYLMTLVSEVSFLKGIELVGPVPKELDSNITFAAGVATSPRDGKAAHELIKYLKSPAAAPAFQKWFIEQR